MVIILNHSYIISFFEFPQEMGFWMNFIPLSIFLASSYLALNNWLIRKKQFKQSSFNKIIRRSAEGGTQLSAGSFIKKKGLIIGSIVGDFVNFTFGLYQVKKAGLNFNFNLSQIKITLKKYKDFPIYSALPSLFNSISLFLPIIIINKIYSQEITGYVDLSRQMLALPIALISATIAQVLLQKTANYHH